MNDKSNFFTYSPLTQDKAALNQNAANIVINPVDDYSRKAGDTKKAAAKTVTLERGQKMLTNFFKKK